MHYFSLRNISVFSGIFLLFFGFTIWMLSTLPGSSNMACVVGAYLTAGNVLLNLLLSAIIGLTVVNMVELSSGRKTFVSKSGVIGSSLVFLTSFCATCTLPILAGLGIGGALSLVSVHHGLFQTLAVLICAYSLFSSHKKVTSECKICVQ